MYAAVWLLIMLSQVASLCPCTRNINGNRPKGLRGSVLIHCASFKASNGEAAVKIPPSSHSFAEVTMAFLSRPRPAQGDVQ